jgi:NagD protein
MRKSEIDGLIFDLDGTIYLGEEALPGAVEVISELRRRGKRILFVSNKPVEPRQTYANKLTRLGIPTPPEDVITSAAVLGAYLARHAADLNLYVVGEENLRSELRAHGLRLVEELLDQDPTQVIEPVDIDAVVVAFDRTLDYRKLNTAYQALVRGARFFATNSDKVCPMPAGGIPDAGAILAYLEYLTGRKPELVAGKPSPLILRVAAEKLALAPQRCLVVGDRLETDIRMGSAAGMLTAVVLTGVTRQADLATAEDQPNIVLDDLGELMDHLL